jgi:hypothetical protein
MTAEVAVLNRNAVALAADSAVTLQLPEGPKIYQTNKLFTLSKYEPVGIMIYGAADFMNVPWETIVKRYRAQLGPRKLERLDDYGRDFLAFIERRSNLFPRVRQENSCYSFVRNWLRDLKNRLRSEAERIIESRGSISERKVRSLFRDVLNADIKHLRQHPKLPRFARVDARSMVRSCRRAIRLAVLDELEKLETAAPRALFEQGAVLAMTRNLYWHDESGIVIAGFGESEFLPSLRCYTVDLMVRNRLRVLENPAKRTDITETESAAVIAFAQSEMVALFMNGIDEDYADFIGGFIAELLQDRYPTALGNLLQKHIPHRTRDRMLRRLRKLGEQLTDNLGTNVSTYSRMMHSEPIIDIVNQLPKEELAAMAEALVNLTSFKRHVTRQAETVGGPIDVAVISRGDGFIWIKRKHYFKKEFNPQFFSNYFNDVRGKIR